MIRRVLAGLVVVCFLAGPASARGQAAERNGRIRLEVEVVEDGGAVETRVVQLDLGSAGRRDDGERLAILWALAFAGASIPALFWLNRRRPKPVPLPRNF